jgi:ABC-2 type transport system permease protein
MSFWFSDMEGLGIHLFTSLLTFASQPASIFDGWYKLFILTVIPAGFISLLPVELIKHFSTTTLALLLCGSLIILFFSIWFFIMDLKTILLVIGSV